MRISPENMNPNDDFSSVIRLQPTLCHYFVRLLQDKGLLLRHYTQVGLPEEVKLKNLE